MKKNCIVIVGPTAVGKTALAISLAKQFSTKIISADSRQCFKELNIGVAKPTATQLGTIQHYFINSHSVHDTVNAAVFEKYALEKADEIFSINDTAIMVGGTGLYVKAFCHGMDPMPVVAPGLRQKIVAAYQANGMAWLQQEVQSNDPIYFSLGETQNPQRLMRALEVKLSTGKSITAFQTQQKIIRDFKITTIGLQLPAELLHQRINDRVDQMIAAGLPAEVNGLMPLQHLNALQTVGYRELLDYFSGKTTMELAVAAIKNNTRQYAKRQMTWFKKDTTVKWCTPDHDEVMRAINTG